MKRITLAADRYRNLKVARESELRCSMLGSLVEIQRAIADALSGISPNRLLWGPLTAEEFLRVTMDLTTWSLTHFEPVRAWSIAEDLTPAEEQEGYGLVGRMRRISIDDYATGRSVRTLRDLTHPKVRGAALWVAHALMSPSHVGASDRRGRTLHDRQVARILQCSPIGRDWLAQQQQHWPGIYLRRWWDAFEANPFHTDYDESVLTH